jgi:hypothetical protein
MQALCWKYNPKCTSWPLERSWLLAHDLSCYSPFGASYPLPCSPRPRSPHSRSPSTPRYLFQHTLICKTLFSGFFYSFLRLLRPLRHALKPLSPLSVLIISSLQLLQPLLSLLCSFLILDCRLEPLPLQPIIFVEYTARDQRNQSEALCVDTGPEHAIRLVVVTLPDRLCCLIESIDSGGAANGDEGLFFYSAP